MPAKQPVPQRKIGTLLTQAERAYRQEMARLDVACTRVGQLLSVGAPELVEDELEKELSAIDEAHRKIEKTYQSMLGNLRRLGLTQRQVNDYTIQAVADVHQARGWAHAMHSLIKTWADQIEHTRTLKKLQRKLQKLQEKEQHKGLLGAEGKEVPETMYK